MINFWKDYFFEFAKPSAIYVDILLTKLIILMIYLIMKNLLDFQKLWLNFEFLLYINYPQSKGRVERSFRTHQDRVIKKLRLLNIKFESMANQYIKDIYIPSHNEKYSIKAVSDNNLYIPLSNEEKKGSTSSSPKNQLEKLRKMILFTIIILYC